MDAFSCRSLTTKEPLIIGLFRGSLSFHTQSRKPFIPHTLFFSLSFCLSLFPSLLSCSLSLSLSFSLARFLFLSRVHACARSLSCSVYLSLALYIYKAHFVQPITDRVAQNLEMISQTLSMYQNSAHGLYD